MLVPLHVKALGVLLLAAGALSPAAWPAYADEAADFLAGRSRACVKCALVAAQLKQKDLSGDDLTGADLSRAVMHRAKLGGATLNGANLTDANLNKTDLKTASLVGAKAENAMFYGSDLSAADLSDADLANAKMQTAFLVRAKLDHAKISEAMLNAARLDDASLRDADLSKTNLVEASLRRANLEGANLDNAGLMNAVLRDAKLKGAKLTEADLYGADLSDADLTGRRPVRRAPDRRNSHRRDPDRRQAQRHHHAGRHRASLTARSRSRFAIVRIEKLEPCPAVERALGIFMGVRIDVMLAGFAQKMRLHGQSPLRHRLFTALLDEHAADRGLALGRREIRAIPSISAIAIDHGHAEQMRHAAFGRRCARIAHHANAAQYPAVVKQSRENDGMAGDPRAGPLRRVTRLAERLGDVFVLVVETGRDFTQPACLRPAFFELRPGVELLTRRSAIAAAGELAPAVQCHRLGGKPKF